MLNKSINKILFTNYLFVFYYSFLLFFIFILLLENGDERIFLIVITIGLI